VQPREQKIMQSCVKTLKTMQPIIQPFAKLQLSSQPPLPAWTSSTLPDLSSDIVTRCTLGGATRWVVSRTRPSRECQVSLFALAMMNYGAFWSFQNVMYAYKLFTDENEKFHATW